MKPEEAIDILKYWKQMRMNPYAVDEALEIAINAMEKDVPKKVEKHEWMPSKCPTCGCDLSESVGDGYYKHWKHLKRCTNIECCQRLDWGESNDN